MQFEIVDTKTLNKNTLKGTFSLMAGPLKISDFTFHRKGDKFWVGFPAKEYFDKETGEKKYWPIIRIEDKDRYYKFQEWAISEVSELFTRGSLKENQGEEIPF